MKSRLNKEIGKRISYLRKQRGLIQEKLAELLNIATTSLSYIETGRGFMTLATLEKMSQILQVEPYEIFQFSSVKTCLLYTSPSPRDLRISRMPSSA